MGSKSSRQSQLSVDGNHHFHQGNVHPHVGWDHRIAQVGSHAIHFANHEMQHLHRFNDLIAGPAGGRSDRPHNRSGRRKHGHNSPSLRQALGVRKSQSAGNLVGSQFLTAPGHADGRQRKHSSASHASAKSESGSSLVDSSVRLRRKKHPDEPHVTVIDPHHFTNIRRIGHGNFGTVYHAIYNNAHDVALKTLNDAGAGFADHAAGADDEGMRELLGEANIMKRLRHANVLRIIGVTFFGDRGELSLVTDFMKNGSLLDYLKRYREVFLRSHPQSIEKKLNNFGRQIYAAMAYLEERDIIHRDLAARNCLIGEDDTLKVGDFGLTRLTDSGLYRGTHKTICAPRWTAPEALFASQYSSRSDVWSYGITLWEMYTMGERPFGSLQNSVVNSILKNPSESMARHLPKPRRFCSDEAYTHIMLLCLTHNVLMRPRFRDLHQRILTILM